MKTPLRLLSLFAGCLLAHGTHAQCTQPTYTGEGTYYDYSAGGGNCSFPTPYLNNLHSGAMNQAQYANSQICGACAEVTGERGTIISLDDRCAGCQFGDIDLEEDAFPLIADPLKGRVPISWKLVACPVAGPLVFNFKEGSSPWWKSVQVRNHRYPIAKLECKLNGQYVEQARVDYNYFPIVDPGNSPGPFDFRITDSNGQVVEELGIPLQDNADPSAEGPPRLHPRRLRAWPRSIRIARLRVRP